jgi:hypothetical protein
MLKSAFIREVTLYRYRYGIGYGTFIALLFALLLFGISDIPRGLTSGEMQSAINSVNINVLEPKATNVIDAPYHLLQKASIQMLGLTPLAIKLPSVILGAISGLALIIMLQRWFRRNVAVITAIITSTSVGFISMSRLGEPLIMTTFWTIILLLASTFVLHSSRAAFLWKVVCFVSVGMLLYSPLGVYPLTAMVIAGLLHPHVRHRLKQGKWWQFVLIILTFCIVVTPLAIAIVKRPELGLQLIGISDLHFTVERFTTAISSVASGLFNFSENRVGPVTLPLFSIATCVLLLLGFLKLATASYSARSYMLFIWLGLLVPVLLLNPSAILIIITPISLVLAIGIETLIREWYGLFPRNPYARIGAIVPLSILLISIVTINVERYFYGNHYSDTRGAFHTELASVRNGLERKDINQTNVRLVVPHNQLGFYDVLRREYPKLNVSDTIVPGNAKGSLLVTGSNSAQPAGQIPYRILTNDLSENAAQVRIYTNW